MAEKWEIIKIVFNSLKYVCLLNLLYVYTCAASLPQPLIHPQTIVLASSVLPFIRLINSEYLKNVIIMLFSPLLEGFIGLNDSDTVTIELASILGRRWAEGLPRAISGRTRETERTGNNKCLGKMPQPFSERLIFRIISHMFGLSNIKDK